ncbi:hypothetical protein RND71_025948 [Anisodus tanguticus]|uniref:Uncharacterized protein n=1 Tax=Anisodus tanguticus TaxID=243964 RepID=A0AAE1V9Z8_9SOLA|nr:hypothetical protein RND71_025948 [Anisodus tanguticus]
MNGLINFIGIMDQLTSLWLHGNSFSGLNPHTIEVWLIGSATVNNTIKQIKIAIIFETIRKDLTNANIDEIPMPRKPKVRPGRMSQGVSSGRKL